MSMTLTVVRFMTSRRTHLKGKSFNYLEWAFMVRGTKSFDNFVASLKSQSA